MVSYSKKNGFILLAVGIGLLALTFFLFLKAFSDPGFFQDLVGLLENASIGQIIEPIPLVINLIMLPITVAFLWVIGKIGEKVTAHAITLIKSPVKMEKDTQTKSFPSNSSIAKSSLQKNKSEKKVDKPTKQSKVEERKITASELQEFRNKANRKDRGTKSGETHTHTSTEDTTTVEKYEASDTRKKDKREENKE